MLRRRPIQHRWCEAECDYAWKSYAASLTCRPKFRQMLSGACKSFPWPSHALTGARGILVAQAHHWHCNGNTFSWLVGLISEYCQYRPFLKPLFRVPPEIMQCLFQ
ncbi:hypothetical protein ASPTUDRAFT_581153 [Aspergillus tubingensis CBS 134.48]|uniref:Uncharacterized protein n=1 Tax=Aspergillus tubingensis (strain CBS 134.48) TaxID=767770 RepID=A0A1L9N848_ASPTC|nr:hypothetical protein ASPTUDRAFT_581153 [Aspergillus tubingensis CBS 134.48]